MDLITSSDTIKDLICAFLKHPYRKHIAFFSITYNIGAKTLELICHELFKDGKTEDSVRYTYSLMTNGFVAGRKNDKIVIEFSNYIHLNDDYYLPMTLLNLNSIYYPTYEEAYAKFNSIYEEWYALKRKLEMHPVYIPPVGEQSILLSKLYSRAYNNFSSAQFEKFYNNIWYCISTAQNYGYFVVTSPGEEPKKLDKNSAEDIEVCFNMIKNFPILSNKLDFILYENGNV